MTKIRIVQNASGTMERQDFPNIVGMSAKASVTFALRRGYGGRTPSELTETCGGRSVSEVALGHMAIFYRP